MVSNGKGCWSYLVLILVVQVVSSFFIGISFFCPSNLSLYMTMLKLECQLKSMSVQRYRDFKRSLQQALDGRSGEAARQTVDFLIQVNFLHIICVCVFFNTSDTSGPISR